MLESLAEVDAKFVKVVDKECEVTSNDLKKWFKKLAVRNTNIGTNGFTNEITEGGEDSRRED